MSHAWCINKPLAYAGMLDGFCDSFVCQKACVSRVIEDVSTSTVVKLQAYLCIHAIRNADLLNK